VGEREVFERDKKAFNCLKGRSAEREARSRDKKISLNIGEKREIYLGMSHVRASNVEKLETPWGRKKRISREGWSEFKGQYPPGRGSKGRGKTGKATSSGDLPGARRRKRTKLGF